MPYKRLVCQNVFLGRYVPLQWKFKIRQWLCEQAAQYAFITAFLFMATIFRLVLFAMKCQNRMTKFVL